MSRASVAAWGACFLAVAAALQLAAPVPLDADTGYHVAVARLIREHGILQAFPWTPFSWLADHYADKELLFHLLIAPFAGMPWMAAARIAGTIAGAALLAALYGILRSEGVKWAGPWTLTALASSSYFAYRFALVRPHLLATALALLVAWAAARRRLAVLAAASFLYPFAYVAWHSALVLAVLAELGHVLAGRRADWRPGAVVAGSLAAALLVHPNFPNVVEFAWVVSYEILFRTAWAGKVGFPIGSEFQGADVEGLVRFALVPFALTTASIVTAARRRDDPVASALALCAAAYATMTVFSWRFVEYWAPFAVAAAATTFRAQRIVLPAGAAAAGLALALTIGRGPLQYWVQRQPDVPPPIARVMRATIPEDAQVFTCGWGFTGELMLELPRRRFMVALDPVLFHRKDAALYRVWYEVVRRPPERPSAVVRESFGARYAVCEHFAEHEPFLAAMDRDPGARRVFAAGLWSIYELRDR